MKIIVVLFFLFTYSASAQNQLFNTKDMHSFTGKWTGKLEYRDFKDNSKMVTLVTNLQITGAADSLVLRYEYAEPNGRIIKSREAWEILSSGEQLRMGDEIFDISAVDRVDNGINLTLDREGKDNDKISNIRKTVALSQSSFVITKRIKYPEGEFFVRNTHTFRKN